MTSDNSEAPGPADVMNNPSAEARAREAVEIALKRAQIAQQAGEASSQLEAESHSGPETGAELARADPVHPVAERRVQSSEYTQHDVENVNAQMSRVGFRGIRSLPHAFERDFRMRLYGTLVVLGKLWRTRARERASRLAAEHHLDSLGSRGSAPVTLLAYGVLCPPHQTPVLAGQSAPGVYSSLRHFFTLFEHRHSDFLAEEIAHRERRAQQKSVQLVSDDFVVTAMPSAPKGSTLFDEFTYMEDPYEIRENLQRLESLKALQKRVGGRYLPGGKAHQHELSKASLVDCLLQLQAGLRADWPLSFIQVFEDVPGNILISFHKALAAQEGDITAYMNQHYRTNLTVQKFKLMKESTQWGMLADPASEFAWGVYYVYWPPWANRLRLTPEHLAGPRPSADARKEASSCSGPSTRDPFGKRTDAGLLQNWNVRSHEHTMR